MDRYFLVNEERFITLEEKEQIEKENEKCLESENPADWFKAQFIMIVKGE